MGHQPDRLSTVYISIASKRKPPWGPSSALSTKWISSATGTASSKVELWPSSSSSSAATAAGKHVE